MAIALQMLHPLPLSLCPSSVFLFSSRCVGGWRAAQLHHHGHTGSSHSGSTACFSACLSVFLLCHATVRLTLCSPRTHAPRSCADSLPPCSHCPHRSVRQKLWRNALGSSTPGPAHRCRLSGSATPAPHPFHTPLLHAQFEGRHPNSTAVGSHWFKSCAR